MNWEMENANMVKTASESGDARPNAAEPSGDSAQSAGASAVPAERAILDAAVGDGCTKIAIVTGATSGLGLEFARQIADAHVVDEIWLIARNEEKLTEIAGTLPTPAIGIPADLSSTADIATIAAKIAEEHIAIKYLINSAGFGKMGAWDQISDADAMSMIDLNCKGLVCMTRACLPYMCRGSRVIQVASAAGFAPLPYMNVYAATKAFVINYTRALRWEVRSRGICVTALCPTWVKTGFEARARDVASGHASVRHTLFAQSPRTVVAIALADNRAHFAISCASVPSLCMRIIGKIVPDAITMAGWQLIRRL